MGFAVRTVLVLVVAILLPAGGMAETLELRVFHVATGLDLGDGAGPPASDYYLDGGTADGLAAGMRLPVFRELGVRDALRDRRHEVRMEIGELELLRVFEGTAVARVSAIDPARETPLFEPRAVMIGDYVLPALRRPGRSRGDDSPDPDNAEAVDDLPDDANDRRPTKRATAKTVDAGSVMAPPPASVFTASPETYLPGFPSAKDWYPLPPPVLFELNSSELDREAQYGLEGVALVLAEKPERLISLEGRTCSLGSTAYNHALSLRRARTVAAFLQSRGVASDRVSVTGFGEGSPIRRNDSEAERRHNRRVDLRVGSMGPTLEPEIPGITR